MAMEPLAKLRMRVERQIRTSDKADRGIDHAGADAVEGVVDELLHRSPDQNPR